MNVAQVMVYLDEARRLKAAACKAGAPAGCWVAELVRNRTHSDWPPGARELAGGWPDFRDLNELRAV